MRSFGSRWEPGPCGGRFVGVAGRRTEQGGFAKHVATCLFVIKKGRREIFCLAGALGILWRKLPDPYGLMVESRCRFDRMRRDPHRGNHEAHPVTLGGLRERDV